MSNSDPRAIFTFTPTYRTITWIILMLSLGCIKCSDTLVRGLPPHQNLYPPSNIHIYAYRPHHYIGNTHDKLWSHKMFRHCGASFTPPNELQFTPSKTHIYAYGHHYYMSNTHVKLASHKIFRHCGARLTPI